MALRLSRELAEKLAEFKANYPKGYASVSDLLDAIDAISELAEAERDNDFVDVDDE
jgi:hypothetical protein